MRHSWAYAALLALIPLAAACSQNARDAGSSGFTDARHVAVTSTDEGCALSSTEAPAGTLTFDVTNQGSQVTEFYLLSRDSLRVVGEVENVGPQLSRQLVINASEGDYVTSCKPGMKGDGIRAAFTVTQSDQQPTVAATEQRLAKSAQESYRHYVQNQSDHLVTKTRRFVDLYVRGRDDAARALYPRARTHWERIEPVAESFGDLDPKTDAREADLADGQEWTGWHRIEKDLWPPATGYTALSSERRAHHSHDLLENVETVDRRIQKLTYTVDQIANGARGLMEEVATAKVTGEEEIWSHTDLWDFQANVDGARVAFENLKPIVEERNPRLATTLTDQFAALDALLDAQRSDEGFRFYDQLRRDEIRQLWSAVNSLAEPLSVLTPAVVS